MKRVQHVAAWYGLDWDTVKALDNATPPARLLPVDLAGVESITMAEIVYALFHVVAQDGREGIDRVRGDEAHRLRQDRAARPVI